MIFDPEKKRLQNIFSHFSLKTIFNEKLNFRVEKWKASMYKRGYEPAIRKIEDGPVFRYRTTHQQRVARKRRLQIQYETHFIRLRALSKVRLQLYAVSETIFFYI